MLYVMRLCLKNKADNTLHISYCQQMNDRPKFTKSKLVPQIVKYVAKAIKIELITSLCGSKNIENL